MCEENKGDILSPSKNMYEYFWKIMQDENTYVNLFKRWIESDQIKNYFLNVFP